MKKRIALLLVLMLLVSLLAACGEEESSAKKGKTREGQKSSASVTPTEEVSVTPVPTDGPEPTDGPIPTGEPDPTPTPRPATPTPTPVSGPGSDDFTYDRPNVALLAFSDYIDDMYAGLTEEEQMDFRFGLLLLNGDYTPELWWTDGDYHASAVHICLYDGKNVKEIGAFGSFGGCGYLEFQNVVTSEYMAMGTSIFGAYELKGKEFVPMITLTRQDHDDGTSTFYIDDEECSEGKYNEWYDYYYDLGSWEIVYDDGIDLAWEMIYEEDVVSSYNLLYPEYLDYVFDEDPFEYDVPDDVLEALAGKWELTGGENDGRKWSASDYGAVSYVTFNDDCTVTVEDVVPDPQTEEFDLLYLYWQGLTDDGAKWIVGYEYENENTSDAEYVYTLLKDGTLIRFYYDYDNENEAITYYKRVK